MWHRVSVVAKTHKFNAQEFEKFAMENKATYAICDEFGFAEVNTWHVDALIGNFKKLVCKPIDNPSHNV